MVVVGVRVGNKDRQEKDWALVVPCSEIQACATFTSERNNGVRSLILTRTGLVI